MSERFFPPIELQDLNHCGPASLSMCLGILGIHAGQRALARAAGKPFRIYSPDDEGGLDEAELRRAASRFHVRTRFLFEAWKNRGRFFLADIKRHLEEGNPLLLLVQDFGHWIAVVGRVNGRFVIYDPDDSAVTFSYWKDRTLLKHAWNKSDDDEEEIDQYFAILTSRRDGRPPRYFMTPAFLRLCEKGSEETAPAMFHDLAEMAWRAAGGRRRPNGPPLYDVLARMKPIVVDSVWHWVAESEVSLRDIEELYDDYVIVASATGIRIPAHTDIIEIVAQLTTLLTTYAWTGKL